MIQVDCMTSAETETVSKFLIENMIITRDEMMTWENGPSSDTIQFLIAMAYFFIIPKFERIVEGKDFFSFYDSRPDIPGICFPFIKYILSNDIEFATKKVEHLSRCGFDFFKFVHSSILYNPVIHIDLYLSIGHLLVKFKILPSTSIECLWMTISMKDKRCFFIFLDFITNEKMNLRALSRYKLFSFHIITSLSRKYFKKFLDSYAVKSVLKWLTGNIQAKLSLQETAFKFMGNKFPLSLPSSSLKENNVLLRSQIDLCKEEKRKRWTRKLQSRTILFQILFQPLVHEIAVYLL